MCALSVYRPGYALVQPYPCALYLCLLKWGLKTTVCGKRALNLKRVALYRLQYGRARARRPPHLTSSDEPHICTKNMHIYMAYLSGASAPPTCSTALFPTQYTISSARVAGKNNR